MDKLEEEQNGRIEVMSFESLLAKQFFKVRFRCLIRLMLCLRSLFVGREAVILSCSSNFFVNVKVHSRVYSLFITRSWGRNA